MNFFYKNKYGIAKLV